MNGENKNVTEKQLFFCFLFGIKQKSRSFVHGHARTGIFYVSLLSPYPLILTEDTRVRVDFLLPENMLGNKY